MTLTYLVGSISGMFSVVVVGGPAFQRMIHWTPQPSSSKKNARSGVRLSGFESWFCHPTSCEILGDFLTYLCPM